MLESVEKGLGQMDDLERAEKSREDVKRALRGSTEELRAYMADAKRLSTTVRSQRARDLYVIYIDRCLEELIRRGHITGGKVGGRSRSAAKVAATRKNAAIARATRTRRYPPCPGYKNRSHRFSPAGKCYSPACREQYPNLLQDGKIDVEEWVEEIREAHSDD